MLQRHTWLETLLVAGICVLFTACAAKRATIPLERAEFYREQAERIFREAAELDAVVYATATPEQQQAKARLQGEIVAFWKVFLQDITVEDSNLTQLIQVITQALTIL